MRTLLITASAVALLIGGSAHAADVGDVLHFRPDVGIVVCADPKVAARELHTRVLSDVNAIATLGFKNYRKQDLSLRGFDKACHVLDSDVDWKIVQKGRTQYTGPNDTWACLVPTDLPEAQCEWTFLFGRPQ